MTEPADPYVDTQTGILHNLVGARTKGALDEAEGALSFARLVQFDELLVRPTRDLEEFCAIHRQLFQDVYSWAGHIRVVDLRKSDGAAEPFMLVSAIARGAQIAADELYQDKMLWGLNRSEMVERLSHHYDQWNYIHPFREGNGRTQRVFWNRVAADAGWRLDWRSTLGAVNDAACRAATEHRDFSPLLAMFDSIVSPLAHQRGDLNSPDR